MCYGCHRLESVSQRKLLSVPALPLVPQSPETLCVERREHFQTACLSCLLVIQGLKIEYVLRALKELALYGC